MQDQALDKMDKAQLVEHLKGLVGQVDMHLVCITMP